MSYYSVSEESLTKVQDFLVKEVRRTGSKNIQMTVPDLADGAGVSLATAHKATKVLESEGLIEIIVASSKRIPNIYNYKGDLDTFERKIQEMSQIEYLKDLVNKLTEERNYWRDKFQDAEVESRRLRGMLGLRDESVIR